MDLKLDVNWEWANQIGRMVAVNRTLLEDRPRLLMPWLDDAVSFRPDQH